MRKHFRIHPPSLAADKIANCFLEIFFLPSREMGTKNERTGEPAEQRCMSCDHVAHLFSFLLNAEERRKVLPSAPPLPLTFMQRGDKRHRSRGCTWSLSLSLSLWAPSETRPRPPPVAKQVCTTCQEVRLLTLTLRLPFFTAPHPSGENTIASARE